MVDWNLANVDPMKSVQQGRGYVDQIYDQAAKLQAGKQYAAGDMAGASRTFAERGDIKSAAALDEAGQGRAEKAYEYIGRALPVFEAIAAKHAADPDKGASKIAEAFDSVAGELQQVTGHPPQALAQMRQSLMTDPTGTIMRAKAQLPVKYQVAGRSVLQIQGDNITPVYEGQKDAPAGYEYGTDGKSLVHVPGGPADPKIKLADAEARRDIIVNNPIPSQGNGGQGGFKAGVTLRKEFDQQKDVKDFNDVANSLEVIADIARRPPTAQNDLSLIFSYMKMLDPGSVVREGEFANAQNTAGVPDQVRNAYNKAMNGQRLNPEQRVQFTNTARGIYSSRKRRYDQLVTQYQGYARDNDLPDNIIQARMDAGGAPAGPKILRFNPETGKLE